MRKQKTLLKDVDRCLQVWGEWNHHTLQNGLDFSSRNLLYTVANRPGGMGHTNVLAERVDELIQELGTVNQRSAKVLMAHYSNSGTIRDKAEQIELPKSTYYDLLQQSKHWVSQRLH